MALRPYHIILGLLLGLLMAGAPDILGQSSPFDSARSREAAIILESVDCFTDRSLYITDETIRFSSRLHFQGPSDHGPWSRVLYVELVSAGGEHLAQGKFEVIDGISSGEMRIPADLLSGNYFLRCYTRWMRNRGPETYGYVPLRIINPLRPETESKVQQEQVEASLSPVSETARLEFKAHPTAYNRGDRITMQLFASTDGYPETIRGCITVVPRIARPADQVWEVETTDQVAKDLETGDQNGDSQGPFQLSFLPDRYGPSISGSLVYPDGEEEVIPDTRVHLTLMGEAPAYFIGNPDIFGKFTVALPFGKGGMELFVQPETPDGEAVEVRIDQDFDQRELRFSFNNFALSEQERQVATIMARNIQLSAIYQEPDSTGQESSVGEVIPFYGKPTLSVDMDRYVLLPTLEEVFLNLVSSVNPVTRRNRTTLQIESENPVFSLFAPLIMVDQVPVFDMEKFMSVPPSRIRRIDVIEDVYVIGDIRFGGLINLQSREKDMAGIDLPGNSFFIDYLSMQPAEPVNHLPESPDERIPDTRNTFLWEPDLILEKGGQATISFVAPGYPGQYVVLFRGMGPGGDLIIAETTFDIPD
jgi:hypothetical protein